ncbi:MAG: hypothetical protein U0S12_02200 [Fimbriimonadales bacterium]
MLPTPQEIARRDAVRASLEEHIREGATIKLPPFDPSVSQAGVVALQHIGIEPNPFSGTVDAFRYQFEGEEDLLHLIVARQDGETISPEEGQGVLRFVLPDVPEALVWFKPGKYSQHFFVGHDELLRS